MESTLYGSSVICPYPADRQGPLSFTVCLTSLIELNSTGGFGSGFEGGVEDVTLRLKHGSKTVE